MLADGVEADLAKLTGLGKLKGVGDAFLDEGTPETLDGVPVRFEVVGPIRKRKV